MPTRFPLDIQLRKKEFMGTSDCGLKTQGWIDLAT